MRKEISLKLFPPFNENDWYLYHLFDFSIRRNIKSAIVNNSQCNIYNGIICCGQILLTNEI